jgi:hypothetical protein
MTYLELWDNDFMEIFVKMAESVPRPQVECVTHPEL